MNNMNTMKMSYRAENPYVLYHSIVERAKAMDARKYNMLKNEICRKYQYFPNSYIFSENGTVYLAHIDFQKYYGARVENTIDRFYVSIFINSGDNISQVVFSGLEYPPAEMKDSETLLQDLTDGISFEEIVRKNDYVAEYSCLDDTVKKMIDNIRA